MENQKFQDMLQDLAHLKNARANFNSQYAAIARVCEPGSRGLFDGSQTEGDLRTQDILDATPAIALQRFGSILDSLLTPRNAKWSKVKPSDPKLMQDREVKLYFERANELLFKLRYAPTANFAANNQKDYISLGAYGTSCLFIDELRDSRSHGFRYKSLHLSEFYFDENHQGIPDKVFREFKMSVRQLKQRWENKLPDKVKNAKPTDEFTVVHAVMPNQEFVHGRLDYRGMDYYSCYILVEGCMPLEEGGYTTFPFSVSRYDQFGKEKLGRSPAMMTFPAIKTLMQQKKDVLVSGHRANNPVLLFHDDSIMDGFSLKAGAMNAGGVSEEGKELVKVLPSGRVDIGIEMMEMEKDAIKDAFLVSIFQILTENPQMTAYEVMERTKEKGILLAPVIGRQHTEKLGPQIVREFDMISKWGLLGPMPGLLKEAQGQYDIEYDSPISRAARAEEAVGFMRSVQATVEVANATQDPSVLDIYDFDTALPEIAEINGTPTRWLSSLEKIQQMREGRKEQVQTEQAIQAAPSAVALAKTVQQK